MVSPLDKKLSGCVFSNSNSEMCYYTLKDLSENCEKNLDVDNVAH